MQFFTFVWKHTPASMADVIIQVILNSFSTIEEVQTIARANNLLNDPTVVEHMQRMENGLIQLPTNDEDEKLESVLNTMVTLEEVQKFAGENQLTDHPLVLYHLNKIESGNVQIPMDWEVDDDVLSFDENLTPFVSELEDTHNPQQNGTGDVPMDREMDEDVSVETTVVKSTKFSCCKCGKEFFFKQYFIIDQAAITK